MSSPQDDIVYLNGEFLPKDEAKISASDRGFLFGDGIYEAIPFYRGNPFGMDGHWNRLQNGLNFMKIPYKDSQQTFLDACMKLLEKNNLDKTDRSLVYLQITRGAPPKRNHAFPKGDVKPTVYAFCQEINYPSREQWCQGFTAVLEPDRRWGRVDIKTLNLLPNVLAYQDAKEQGADDAILIRNGVAMEGAHNNFFAVMDGNRVVTHPVTNHVLPGITRAILLEEARSHGIIVEERPIHVEELRDATEAFFTSTTAEVKPCVSIDGKPVGDGKVGKMTKWLADLFHSRIERDTGMTFEQENPVKQKLSQNESSKSLEQPLASSKRKIEKTGPMRCNKKKHK